MNALEIIIAVCSGLGLTGTTLLSVLFFKSTKKTKQAEADKAMAEANKEEWSLEKERLNETHETIMTLNGIIKSQGETISKNNKSLDDKTQRLREAQDREFKANEEKARLAQEKADLIRENGELRLRLQRHECIKLTCIHRDPPNEHTIAARQKEVQPKAKTQQK